MKDSLEFDEDDKPRESGSNWHMGIARRSTMSYDTLGSRVVLHQQNLQILYKNEIPSERPKIEATIHEKLAYYRALVSSPSRTQILSMQQINFNKYLWFYIFNVFCKSLPCTYIYVFLSSYAAEEHFFVSKMIPLCHGLVWHAIISGYISLLSYSEYIVFLWDYLISGLLYKNPWNRCASYYNVTVNTVCYDVKDFTLKVQNHTTVFQKFGYRLESDPHELFQLAPILFLKSRMVIYSVTPSLFWFYQCIVIVVGVSLYKQFFKKYLWKILNYTEWLLIFMFFVTFCHLVIFYFMNGFKHVPTSVDDLANELWNADIDMLTESMTSPPIVHILSSRGTTKVKPSRDSTAIVVSNAIYYIFKGILSYMMKRYCESMIGVSLSVTEFNPCSSLYLWPIYCSYFYLGDYYAILYFLLNGIVEFLVLVVSLNCMVEAIACEWRLWPWCVACSLCAATVVYTTTSTVITRGILYVYVTGISTLAEIIAVFCLYPLGRLIDDITFHCGAPPTTLRVWSLRIVPIYYAVKWATLLNAFLDLLTLRHYTIVAPYCFKILYVQVVPIILGIFYALIEILCRKKQSWKQLFVPVPDWGPKDPTVRQLRKQYDSRQYIGSQAPRDLSRYFIDKAELTTYQLDIQYDGYAKQRNWQNEMRFENEKKDN